MSEYINLAVPFFSQRENIYVWCQKDEKTGFSIGNRISMACQSCSITSLCMILQYLGISDDSPDDAMKKIYEENFKSWCYNKSSYSWLGSASILQTVLTQIYNIDNEKIEIYQTESTKNIRKLHYSDIKEYLKQGFPIWFSWGILSGSGNGHISVIRGITKAGDLIINDPWGDPTDAYGDVKSDGKGYYYTTSEEQSHLDKLGLGSGDNIIIKKDQFMKMLKQDFASGLSTEDESRYCYQALVIKEKRIWNEPLHKFDFRGKVKITDEDIIKYLIEHESFADVNSRGNYVYAGFPICQNGLWHNGIHLFGAEATPVYSIGPGRIVAIRNAEDVKTNFVLVRYLDFKSQKTFFGLYKNLKYIDLRKRIKNKYSCTLGINKIVQKEALDWVDQLISHIMPKKALVYSESNPEGASGEERYSLKVYDENFNDTGISLKDRSLVFLCPKDENNKKILEDFTKNSKDDLVKINNFITKNATYIFKHDNCDYYKIFAKKKSDTEFEWIEGYVETKRVYPQEFNFQEYTYYREKITKLLNGETVIFNEEDLDSDIPRANKAKYQEVFNKEIKKIFNSALTQQKLLNETDRFKLIGGIRDYYMDLLYTTKEIHEYRYYIKVISTLEKQIYNFCKILFNYDIQLIDDPFTTSDRWLITTKDKHDSFEGIYKEICNFVFSKEETERRWELLLLHIRENRRRNIDFFLECNNRVPIGEIGKSENKTYLHLEIFSEDKLINNAGYKVIKQTDYDSFENKSKTIMELQKAIEYTEDIITQKKFYEYYKDNRLQFCKLIAHICNLNIKLNSDNKLDPKKHKGYTIIELDDSAFIEKNNKKTFGLKKNNSFFYHPIDFINFLNTN